MFVLHHESYHLGQLGMLRRQRGYAAMSYGDRSENECASGDYR